MAADYSKQEKELGKQEKELTDLIKSLKRDLHMHNIRRLRGKQGFLATSEIQRKQIVNLENQKAELGKKVSTTYCPQFAVKDDEIKNYLVYQLKMHDFFSREVATKQEMIKQKDEEIKAWNRKIDSLVKEKAKKVKNSLVKPPEFVRLENMSNKIYQMNQRVSTMRQENKEIMERIISMRKFQRQFKTFETDFRRKIDYLKLKKQGHLDKAVAAYEEKDSLRNKEKMIEEGCAEYMRKAAITENALHLCLEKSEKNEAFAKLLETERTDTRIAETGDRISKGITGLEPNLENVQAIHSALSGASGEEAPDKIGEVLKFADGKMGSMFSYLDELLKDINYLENEINNVKKENKDLIKGMSSKDRKLRKCIRDNQGDAQKKLRDADDAEKSSDGAKEYMNSVLDTVSQLYTTVFPDDTTSFMDQPLDDSNVFDYLQKMEKQLLDNLICIEYLHLKEDMNDIELDDMDKMQLQTLQGDTDSHSLTELDSEKFSLQSEDLEEKEVVAVVGARLEEKGGEETDADDLKEKEVAAVVEARLEEKGGEESDGDDLKVKEVAAVVEMLLYKSSEGQSDSET